MSTRRGSVISDQGQLALPSPAAPLALPEPTPHQREAIIKATGRVQTRHRRAQVAGSPTRFDTVQLHSPHSDEAGFAFELRDAFGTTSGAFARAQIDHIRRIVGSSNGKPDMDAVNAVIAMVDGIGPENEIEAAMAVQVALTDHVAAKMLHLGSQSTQADHRERYLNLATKVQRTMVAQVEALIRLKVGLPELGRIGQVTVREGSQAIIGGTVNIGARRAENGG